MDNHELMDKLILVMQLHRKMFEKRIAVTGMHRAQHRLLIFLDKHPHMSQVEIAKCLEISPATIAVSFKSLERDGIICRQVNKEDNRFNNIEITEKGRQIIYESKVIFKQIEEQFFEQFSETDKESLGKLLEKLYQNLSCQVCNDQN